MRKLHTSGILVEFKMNLTNYYTDLIPSHL